MTNRSVINGKVLRAPSLERLDAMVSRDNVVATAGAGANRDPRAFKAGLFEKDGPRTWEHDKALLVALGVDGDVQFERAARNAGLPTMGQERGVKFANKTGYWRIGRPANNNHKIAAAA